MSDDAYKQSDMLGANETGVAKKMNSQQQNNPFQEPYKGRSCKLLWADSNSSFGLSLLSG